MGKHLHVTPRKGNWAVQTEKSERAAKITETQKEAIEVAREIAKKRGSELLIHGKNGRIRQKNSYGNDPFPPKG